MSHGSRPCARFLGIRVFVFALGVSLADPAGIAAQPSAQDPVELQETNAFGLGARVLGMGNAAVGVADEASALHWNPAGLAQMHRSEIAAGLTNDNRERTTTHFQTAAADRDHTRFSHFLGAFPIPGTGHRSVTLGLGYQRWADLDDIVVKEGLLIEPNPDGLYEYENYRRNGALDAWTAAVGFELTPNLALGGSVRLLSGSSHEDHTLANYRARQSGDDLVLDLGDPGDPDLRVFQQDIIRDADAFGVTGSVGILGQFESGLRLGAVIDLPATFDWEGDSWFRFEDTEKIDGSLAGYPDYYRDDITLPLSLAGGLSFENELVLLAGDVRWTDYAQIDFEGEILVPTPGGLVLEPAYRSVVSWNLGAELHLPDTPMRLRAGYFTQPVPYELMAADTDFTFVADDGDPDTFDDYSYVNRDYPEAEIDGDRDWITVGAGLVLEDAFSIDAAYAWGSWSRQTVSGYQNSTTLYPTRTTRETVDESRFSLSATARFR